MNLPKDQFRLEHHQLMHWEFLQIKKKNLNYFSLFQHLLKLKNTGNMFLM